MIGKFKSMTISYSNLTLGSGAVINSAEVTFKPGERYQVSETNRIYGQKDNKNFDFYLREGYTDGNGKIHRTLNVDNWPSGLSVDSIVQEFVDFVENDVATFNQ